MLVDRQEVLDKIFSECTRLNLPLMTHCEDTTVINENMRKAKAKYGEDPDIHFHPLIRSEKACLNSSTLAVALARKHDTRLHIAHISTAKELELIEANNNVDHLGAMPLITCEAVLAHLLFTDKDYTEKGALIKCNPAVKTTFDREALRMASGMPMVQFSLVSMLQLVDEGVLTIERLVWLMCHNPARLFAVTGRGFLRPKYKADITIVKRGAPWTLTESLIQSKCQWSPLTGSQFRWRVVRTICNGHTVYHDGNFDDSYRGEALTFRK